MKKATNFSLLVYVIFLIALYFIGTSVLAPANSVLGSKSFLFFIIAILIGFIICVILMEIGHIIGALIGGYRIVSVSFMWLNFRKVDNKLTVKLLPFDGFTGETKIAPKKEKANPLPFFWGGTLLLLVVLILGIYLPVFILADETVYVYLKYGSYVVSIIAGLLLVYNIIPLPLDTKNDAIMMKNVTKENIKVFNELCLLKESLMKGESFTELTPFSETDYLKSQWNYYVYLAKTYQGEYQQAEAIIDSLIQDSDKLSEDVYRELSAAKVFLIIMGKSIEDAKEYFKGLSQAQRKLISDYNSVEGSRNYFALLALVIESKDDAVAIYKKYQAKKKHMVETGRLFDEEQLMGLVLNKIHEHHPDWTF